MISQLQKEIICKKIEADKADLRTFAEGVGFLLMMALNRKWKLDLLDRNDLMSLSKRAEKVTGIPIAEEIDKEVIEKILG